MENIKNLNIKSNIIYSKVSNAGKEKYIGLKITNLNELKRATPRLKLPSILSPTIKKNQAVPKEIKQKLQKYCRTCAGLKVPLIDIFSDKGNQMRLFQQIQHLEDIDKDDSLSTQMCMDCIYDMKISYKFFMQIKKAEMKLKLICDSYSSSVLSKPASVDIENETDDKTKNCLPLVLDELVSKENETNFNDKGGNCEASDTEYSETNETYDQEIQNSFEEFEAPDSSQDCQEEKVDKVELEKTIKEEVNQLELSSNAKNTAYKYDESINAYVKIEVDKESTPNAEPQISTVKSVPKDETITIAHSKTPNILKRKLSSGNISDDSAEKISKKDLQKLNLDLKVKIPKLNLQDGVSVKSEEDGVMYVTAKGSNPNEMLLIKVRKVDKSLEKKSDKVHGKKKSDAAAALKPFLKFDNCDQTDIDKQIEQYKKKRVQVLGDIANLTDEEIKGAPEIRTLEKNELKVNDIEIKEAAEIKDNSNSSETIIETISSKNIQLSEKTKLKLMDNKLKYTELSKEAQEDCIERLKSVLKQKDEYIAEFMNYLKQRKITVTRLRNEDLISLYETKNNVVIDRDDDEFAESMNPREKYDCDFCFRTFASQELENEHSKIHEFRIMHFCEDCKQEFLTHKAKRAHNNACAEKIICKYCKKILESKGKKRQCEQKHSDEQHGQLCDRCGEKFKHLGTLDQHVKSKHMHLEKIFKCPQCPKRFALRTKLTFHLKTVHTNCRAFLCEDCGSDFKNPASLRHHRIRKHQAANSRKECPECQKSVPVYSMSKHMHTHKAYSIACAHCDKKFKNTSTLKQHLRIHEDQRQYKCDTCGVGFNRRDGLRLHLKVHEKPDSRGLKECACQVCGDKFPNHSMLVIHRNRTHKDGRNYTCHICNRSMMTTRSLEWHLAHIHNETLPGILKECSSIDAETKRVACVHCDKTFKTEMILRNHVKNTHVEKEPMKCLDCDEVFTSEVRLKHHMMVQHGRLEGTFPCPHCPKRFVNQLRLKTHMISHSDERPHTCDVCNFMLKTKIQLIKHKQNRHSNERPLQCRYCEHTCKQVSALVCHERTHTNERPYSCSVCQQRFKYLGDKNKHERRHESLGGTGFKRIVTGRNTNKGGKKRSREAIEHDQDQEHELEQGDEECAAQTEIIEGFQEGALIKLKDGQVITGTSNAAFEQIVMEDPTQGTSNTEVIVGVEEGTVYTEEVTSDHIEPQILIPEIIDESVLQPGTVIQIQQQDETGEIKIVPFMLSMSDLTDVNTEINLTTASITYNN